MSQGYPLAKLLSSIEEKESPIHGNGIFATSSVGSGEYSALPTDPQIADIVEKFGSANAAMMPSWKDILLRAGDEDEEEGSDGEDLGDEDLGECRFLFALLWVCVDWFYRVL